MPSTPRDRRNGTPERPAPAPSQTGRWVLSLVLVALGGIALLLANALVWMDRTVLDSEEFAAVVRRALDDPEVEQRIATVVSDRAVEASALDARIAEELPTELGFAAPIVSEQVRAALERVTLRILASDLLSSEDGTLIAALHERVIALLEDDGLIRAQDNQLVLDLGGITDRVFDRMGVEPSERVQTALDERTEVVILEDATRLNRASFFVRHSEGLTIGLLIAALVGLGAGWALAPNRRLGFLACGVALILVGFVALLGVLASEMLVESNTPGRVLLHHLVDGFEQSLRRQSALLVVVGAVAAASTDLRVRGYAASARDRSSEAVQRVGVVPSLLAGSAVLLVALFTLS